MENNNSKKEFFSKRVLVSTDYVKLLKKNNIYMRNLMPNNSYIDFIDDKTEDGNAWIAINSITKRGLMHAEFSIEDELSGKEFFKIYDQILVRAYESVKDKISALVQILGFDFFLDENIIYIFGRKDNMDEIKISVIDILESMAMKKFVSNFNYNDGEEANSNFSYRELKKYLAVGLKLSESQEVKNFENLVFSIYSGQNPFLSKDNKIVSMSDFKFTYNCENAPFIFVCASSGTGKTQLPFSLNIPLLYLLFNDILLSEPSNNDSRNEKQEIYDYYYKLSKCFIECIKSDVIAILKHESNKNLKIKTEANIFLPDIPLYLNGFIVTVIENMIELHKSHPDEKWIVTQLRIERLDIIPISTENAREKIKAFRTKCNNKQFVIFFDEIEKIENNIELKRIYLYVRRKIKELGLVACYMGTNANIGNFINKEASFGSRAGRDIIWCYVVHKLPPVSNEYINLQKNKNCISIKNKLLENGLEILPVMNLIDNILNICRKERPLFINFLFEAIFDITTITPFFNEQKVFDAIGFFQSCIDSIFQKFIARKKNFDVYSPQDCTNYSFSNLQLMAPEYLHSKLKKVKTYEKNSGIYGHIAYLYVEDDVNKVLQEGFNYFGIHPNPDCTFNHAISFNLRKIKFNSEQTFKPFLEEPIGELLFTCGEGEKYLFLEKVNISEKNFVNKRISVFRFIKSWEFNPLFNTPESASSERWNVFETGVCMAALVATFYEGLKGMTFKQWLSHFIFELDIIDNQDGSIEANNDLFKKYENINIPFCAPSIKAQWDENFAEYLKSNGAHVGFLDGSLGKESRDFKIQFCSAENAILSGECKNYSNGLQLSQINTIIEKLNTFKTQLNIIVCSSLSNSETICNLKDNMNAEILESSCVFYLKKNIKCSLDLIHKGTSQDLRLFLIIETFNELKPKIAE